MMLGWVTSLIMAAGTAVPASPVTPDEIVFRHDTLRPGTARQAGLVSAGIDEMHRIAASYLVPTGDHPRFPAYAGAAVLAAHEGLVVQRFAVGDAVRYAAGREELAPDQRVPARADTIYDLASISKLFTTIVLLQQVEAGRLDLDAPVADHLSGYPAGITARHLLTHTSGLPAYRPFHVDFPTPQARLAAALATPVIAGTTPGAQYTYSDVGLIVLGVLAERITGGGLADAVRAGITEPLGMHDTGYTPGPEKQYRIAATEDETYAGRGLVRGEVHDENAWSLGGVAGHAGIFSTVDDLAILCQMLLNGGTYADVRVLAESTVRAALVGRPNRGLGFELDRHSWMDAMASPVTFGHTGFTGTSLVIDPIAHSFLILLSNRVHPDRNWGTNVVARRALARAFADAHPVRPVFGGTAWRAGRRDDATVTLTAALRRPASPSAATFLLWYDTEPGHDTAYVETSADGVTWQPLPLALRAGRDTAVSDGSITGYGGRRWWQVTAELPAGTTHLRFRYRTDAAAQGRGVYVDHLRVTGGGPLTYTADGWSPSST